MLSYYMFTYYYRIIKHFFSLKCTSPKWLIHLFVSATMRISAFLLIPFTASLIVDNLANENYARAYWSLALFFLSSILYLLCRHYNYWAYYKTANDIHNRLQCRILEKLVTFDPSFTTTISRSELIATAFNDVDKARQFPDFLIDYFANIISTILSAAILCFVDWRIGLIAAGLLLISLISFIRHTKLRDHYLTTQHEHVDEITGLYTQIIDGYKEVQTLNLKDKLKTELEQEKILWRKYHKKQRFHRDFAVGFTPIILGSGRILLYLIAAGLILNGEYNVSLLVLILGYYEDIIGSFDEMSETIDNISRTSVAIERLRRLLNYKTPHMLEFGSNQTDDITGLVEFKNVSFKYEEPPKFAPDGTRLTHPLKKAPSLKNISFTAKPGKITAIVGKSGSGKSTIFRLLLRLYKTKRGEILLDDTNIYDFTKNVYSTNVSIVTQKPFVFDMTIRENLSLVDSNKSNQIKACKLAGIHEDIMKLEKGYDTKLIADGSNLSAGEKQLLSLARTLLSRSEVLLFDEVTSSLDTSSTARIIKVLKELKKNHTIIMITHKPELMNLADKVLVIDNGRLVAEGSPKALLKRSAIFRSLQK
ncbi:ABC transporter ATP-binding protein [Candidatus Saccharibacteria bacterium]|nr:ABC transporter ATP-binding protein [Candidatus Saccharibacteria bacterium]